MGRRKTTLEMAENKGYDLISNLDDKINEIITTIEADNILMEKVKNPVSIYPTVAYILNKDKTLSSMKDRQFDNDTIYQCLLKFQYMIMKLSRYQIIVPTRELFCMFIGWSTAFYQQLLESDGEVQEVMVMIEDYILDFNMSEAQRGNIAQGITKFRTQIAGSHGHSQVTKKEENMQNRSDSRKDREQLQRELEEIKQKALANN